MFFFIFLFVFRSMSNVVRVSGLSIPDCHFGFLYVFFYNVLCASLHFISAFCSSNVYQCYDQSCISKGRLCDGIPDCSGRYFEDETDCQRYHVQDSCKKWWLIGARSDGMYRINYGTTGN